jgi:hypothetical protein
MPTRSVELLKFIDQINHLFHTVCNKVVQETTAVTTLLLLVAIDNRFFDIFGKTLQVTQFTVALLVAPHFITGDEVFWLLVLPLCNLIFLHGTLA